MERFRFWNPTVLYYGKGQIEQRLAAEVAKYGTKVLLVYGGGSIRRNGLYQRVVDILDESGVSRFELAGVHPNPRLSEVRQGIEICRKEGIELLLAVGGGSVIDCTKAISMGVGFEGDVWEIFERRAKATSGLPFGTILTLAATGSEMNCGGVITNWDTKEKLSAESDYTFPKFSFCDPEQTFTVPRDQTIFGACDTLAHCFEHYFHPETSAPLQDRLIESVMKTVIETARTAVDNPTDYDARETMMYCSTMALNEMINMGVRGDWGCHKIEHEVSAIYDIPHGGGLAIIFPHWMDYVLDTNEARFAQMAVRVFGVDGAGKSEHNIAIEGISKVRAFFASIDAPSRLSDYKIDDTHLEEMARQTVRFRKIGQFRKLDYEDVLAILRRSL